MLPYGEDQVERTVEVPVRDVSLEGTLGLPHHASGIVLFAHGSGSSRFSPRNRFVARTLRDAGLGTLLLDLLTTAEEAVDMTTRHHRFDIPMLADRLMHVIDWLKDEPDTSSLGIGLFGASTGGSAALVAASGRPREVRAVVSRGGRPDLADEALPHVRCPTLLIVGGHDEQVIELNQLAMDRMSAEVRLEIVPRATHLFEEPGALAKVAELARDWFLEYLPTRERFGSEAAGVAD